ncbi:MAG TPA: hypothetical protein DCP20_03545 [Coriobacteriia bacterium]|nr:MAG: hypothetical protein XD74_1593 [Actinobacteria bacterium 66_15]HAL29776.1 hypothetical protein [Coriobacteriia bacterium]
MECQLLLEWDDMLNGMGTERIDVYMTQGYHELYRTDAARPVCFAAQGESGEYLLPGILHDPICDGMGYCFESAYGYGGPVSTSADRAFITEASDAVLETFHRAGVTRARLRFHPVLENHCLVGPEWQVTYSRNTAGIDLTGAPVDILRAMHPKHRNMVSRAQRLGLEFVWDPELEHVGEFKALYNGTMDRLQADGAYYYDDAYYRLLNAGLGERVALGVVLDDGVVVSSAIFLRQGPYGHYHLSGSLTGAPPGAGQLLVYGAAAALQESGVRTLHLGGGTTPSADDSLLKFKQRFGTLRFRYHVGEWTASNTSG